MSTQLVDIQPKELIFIFEVKKQSTCAVRLINNTQQHVAFKVKTTSPKKYCVRPNAGVIRPKFVCDFTVTMQSQATVPHDMICKDKFLVQSTVVPDGTTDEAVDNSTFAKQEGKYIQENKLKVVLISPPNSPILLPLNGEMKGHANEASTPKDPESSRIENHTPSQMVAKSVEGSDKSNGEGLNPVKVEHSKPGKEVNSQESKPSKVESKPMKEVSFQEPKPTKVEQSKPVKEVNSQEEKPTKGSELQFDEDSIKKQESKPSNSDILIKSGEFRTANIMELKSTEDVSLKTESHSPKHTKQKPGKEDISHDELKPEKEVHTKEDVIKSREFIPEENSMDMSKKETVKGEESLLAKDRDVKFVKDTDSETTKSMDEHKLVKVTAQMKAKVNELTSKLSEADIIISKLSEDKRRFIHERRSLLSELELLRGKAIVKKVQVGYPLLFVCMVALISFMVGSRLMP